MGSKQDIGDYFFSANELESLGGDALDYDDMICALRCEVSVESTRAKKKQIFKKVGGLNVSVVPRWASRMPSRDDVAGSVFWDDSSSAAETHGLLWPLVQKWREDYRLSKDKDAGAMLKSTLMFFDELEVQPKHRRRGAASDLVTKCIRFLAQKNKRILMLAWVKKDNEAAMGFWRSMGFEYCVTEDADAVLLGHRRWVKGG